MILLIKYQNMLRYYFLKIKFFAWLFLSGTIIAQQNIPVEILAGDKAFSHQMYMTKYMNEDSRFGYFGYMRYESPYEDRNRSNFTGQSLLFYDVAGLISVGGGGYVTNDGFIPQVVAAYSSTVKNFSYTVFLAFEPVKKPNSEVFVLMTYTPALNDDGSWRLFMQLIGSYNFNYKNNLQHNFANQYLRLGLSYNGWQFGAGTDLLQVKGLSSSANTGVFLRREL